VTSAACALAHAGHLETGEVLRWWTWEPPVVLGLAATAVLYGIGHWRLRRRSGRLAGRRRLEPLAFAAGWLALVVALVSPLDALGAILFSAHMAQHEVLMLVAAPLLVLGRPLAPLLWGLPRGGRRRAAGVLRSAPVVRAGHALTGLFAVFALHAALLWVWHLPRLYQAALQSDAVHALQHACFFGSAALFWWAIVHGRYGRSGYGLGVLYVFATALHSSALGVLLTFAPRVFYPAYAAAARQWGLSAEEDQQLAGLIMWVPSGVVFVAIGLSLFAAWIGEAGRRVRDTARGALPTARPPAAVPDAR
jgi:putative membrane protein